MTNSKTKTQKELLEYYRNYREKNREKLRDYNRVYNKLWRKEHGYKNETNSKNRYPWKVVARAKLRIAVVNGLVKKFPCSVCGDILSQAHHADYRKPYDVVWYCSLHHKQEHIRLNNLTKLNK